MASLANSAEVQANGSRNSLGSFGPFLVAQEIEDKDFFATVDLLPQATWLNAVETKTSANRDELQHSQDHIDG